MPTPAAPFLIRFYQYQKERFPFLVHGLLIAAFSFSAIAFSRMVRGAAGFVPWQDYLACLATNLVIFFLLRVSDEHKDRHIDAQYRSYLPVPRGLISLRELRIVAVILILPVMALNIYYYPQLLPFLSAALVYLALMRYEFFAPAWLSLRPVLYMVSHMVIIPLTDIYASAYDWKLAGAVPGWGLLAFFCVSYLNGLVLEIGRKIKPAEREEAGVMSYSGLWGRKAPWVWLGVLTLNAGAATAAAAYAGHGRVTFLLLILFFFLAAMPAFLFLRRPCHRWGKGIELASLFLAFAMYLLLGGVPLVLQFFRPA